MRKNLGIILLYSTIFNSHKFHFIVVFMGSNFCTRLIISLSRKLNIFGDNIVKKIQLICRLSNRLKYTAFYVDAKKNPTTQTFIYLGKISFNLQIGQKRMTLISDLCDFQQS
jgi:hypothetical protein